MLLKFDLKGRRFGRLVPLKHVGGGLWNCVCDCGGVKVVCGAALRNGSTRSCGCLHIERAKSGDNSRRHGWTGTRTHNIWRDMLKRVKHHPDYKHINCAERWRKFEYFLEDMGAAPDGLTIDRIDNMGDYEPGNCRWASRTTQARNRKSNRLIEFNGEVKCLQAWAEESGINQPVLWSRLKAGWSIERALSQPVRR